MALKAGEVRKKRKVNSRSFVTKVKAQSNACTTQGAIVPVL
jgi:hypothetical protein